MADEWLKEILTSLDKRIEAGQSATLARFDKQSDQIQANHKEFMAAHATTQQTLATINVTVEKVQEQLSGVERAQKDHRRRLDEQGEAIKDVADDVKQTKKNQELLAGRMDNFEKSCVHRHESVDLKFEKKAEKDKLERIEEEKRVRSLEDWKLQAAAYGGGAIAVIAVAWQVGSHFIK